jgi:hypothetical protein
VLGCYTMIVPEGSTTAPTFLHSERGVRPVGTWLSSVQWSLLCVPSNRYLLLKFSIPGLITLSAVLITSHLGIFGRCSCLHSLRIDSRLTPCLSLVLFVPGAVICDSDPPAILFTPIKVNSKTPQHGRYWHGQPRRTMLPGPWAPYWRPSV